MEIDLDAEWLEPDGLGGYASGTASTVRTRRYHGLLLCATTPPTGRMTLVNGLDVCLRTPTGLHSLSTHRYVPGVLHPDGSEHIRSFESNPWPRWTYAFSDGSPFQVHHELFVPKGLPLVVLTWRLEGRADGAVLTVRPLLSGRSDHSLHHENPSFRFDDSTNGDQVSWFPYDGVPGITARSNGRYESAPDWYRQFQYDEEQRRGMDCVEDLASPGLFRWDMANGEAHLILGQAGVDLSSDLVEQLRRSEATRRAALRTEAGRLGDAFIVQRGEGRSIIAGYPWFTDWGRDTFISLRGLCLATGRLNDALSICTQWAGAVSEGMVPNRFPDQGEEPEYNSVDASLWYVVAAWETLAAFKKGGREIPSETTRRIHGAIEHILDGYSLGTRFGIHADTDGLLAAGQPGFGLTWMDARIDGVPVTPRIGKPVEIQALWINALRIGAELDARWEPHFKSAVSAFESRFWNEAIGCLNDVVDVDHVASTTDATIRPNQIFAVGGLPFPLLEGENARRVVALVESRLWTDRGIRTLAPADPRYIPRYEGGPAQRDAAYHLGTCWPWLSGPFVEAWLRVHGDKAEARTRFLPAMQLSAEIADAEPPHTLRGCPYQAWSVGERLRIQALLGE